MRRHYIGRGASFIQYDTTEVQNVSHKEIDQKTIITSNIITVIYIIELLSEQSLAPFIQYLGEA